MTNIVNAMLFGVTATDPAVHVTVVAVLIGATAAASYLPARRILRQSPLEALKVDWLNAYRSRMATNGLTPSARRAGMRHANTAASSTPAATRAYVSTSVGEMP